MAENSIEQEAERMLGELADVFTASHWPESAKVRRDELLPLLRELATLRRGATCEDLGAAWTMISAIRELIRRCFRDRTMPFAEFTDLAVKWEEEICGESHPDILRIERDELLAFKTYVHQRLDEAGVPTHPDGKHSREGCRVGDRLDILVERATAKPFDDADLHEIEERAAKAKEPRTDVGFGISLNTTTEVYPELDAEELGETYFVHLNAMTAEKLHDKSSIAAQLAWRDKQIDTLLAALRSRGGEGEK